MAPKLRGGIRQRLGILRDIKGRHVRTSIGGLLARSYQDGLLTAHELREGARAAGSSAGDLSRLASARSLKRTRTRGGKPELTRVDPTELFSELCERSQCIKTHMLQKCRLGITSSTVK